MERVFLPLALQNLAQLGLLGFVSMGLMPCSSFPAPDVITQALVLGKLGYQGLESHFWL